MATLGLVALIIGALGYVFWNNIIKDDSSLSLQPLSTEDLRECLKRFDEKNPPTPGLSDHRDKSECYPNITTTDNLSQEQRSEHKRNSQIISDATTKKDGSKCSGIRGVYYTPYPPNVKKVMIRTEVEAKKECRARVNSTVNHEAQRAERLGNYFELPGWGIHLKWEDEADKVRSYPVSLDSKGIPKTYEFTTQNVEEYNYCTNKNGRLGAITREKDPQKVGKGTYLQTKIGDYYYYDVNPSTFCISKNSATPTTINQTRILIRSMIIGAQSQPNFN